MSLCDRIYMAERGLKDNVALILRLEPLPGPHGASNATATQLDPKSKPGKQGTKGSQQQHATLAGSQPPPAPPATNTRQPQKRRQPAGTAAAATAPAHGGSEHCQPGPGWDDTGDRGGCAGELVHESMLQGAATGSGLLVANTHVLFNTKRGDVKLAQLRVILQR